MVTLLLLWSLNTFSVCFVLLFSGPISAKHPYLFNTYSMKTYFLLHFEHKNDVTVIVKPLHRATMIVMSFLCLKCIIIYPQNECIEKYQSELCSKYDREYDFDVIF